MNLSMTCNFCSLGGRIGLIEGQNGNLEIDVAATECSNCPRAWLNLELYRHPQRLKQPLFFGIQTSYRNIIMDIRQHISEKTAFLLGPTLTIEETALAILLARHAGSDNIALSIPEDEKNSLLKNRVRFSQLEEADVILAVGDPIENSPGLIAKIRNADIINVDNRPGKTSHIAQTAIIPEIGRTAYVLNQLIQTLEGYQPEAQGFGVEPESIRDTARKLRSAQRTGVIFSSGFGHFVHTELLNALSRKISSLLGPTSFFLSLSSGANSRAIQRLLMVNGLGGLEKVTNAINASKIETLFMFGCDIRQTLPNIDISSIQTKIQTAVIPTRSTMQMSHVIPAKMLTEKSGNILNLEEHIKRLNNPMPSGAGFSEENIIGDILEENYTINPWDIAAQLSKYEEPPLKRRKPVSLRSTVMAGYLPTGHHNDGSITEQLTLNQNDERHVRVSTQLARNHDLKDGDLVSIYANSPLRAIIEPRLPDNLLLLPISDPVARQQFIDSCEPGKASLTKYQPIPGNPNTDTPYDYQIVNPDQRDDV